MNDDTVLVNLINGPLSGQTRVVTTPLPMELLLENKKYIFWESRLYASAEGVYESHAYAYSGSATPPTHVEGQ